MTTAGRGERIDRHSADGSCKSTDHQREDYDKENEADERHERDDDHDQVDHEDGDDHDPEEPEGVGIWRIEKRFLPKH